MLFAQTRSQVRKKNKKNQPLLTFFYFLDRFSRKKRLIELSSCVKGRPETKRYSLHSANRHFLTQHTVSVHWCQVQINFRHQPSPKRLLIGAVRSVSFFVSSLPLLLLLQVSRLAFRSTSRFEVAWRLWLRPLHKNGTAPLAIAGM